MIVIDKARTEDFESIQKLFRMMFDIYPENQDVGYPFTESGVNYLKGRIENGFVLAARDDKTIVGFLAGSIEDAIDFKTYRQYGFIQNMFILEDYRRKGIGRMLINRFIDLCKRSNVEFILTDSDANQSIINFYTGLGFKISGVNYIMKIKKDV